MGRSCIRLNSDMADNSSDAESECSGEGDSDRELQIAFAQGLLKPGLNVEIPAPKEAINDVAGMEAALLELQGEKVLPWLERLDLCLNPAPAHSALAIQQQLTASNTDGDVHDDFKREMTFYRQAQAAVLEGIPRLHSMGIATFRPDDYFAEMAKTDA